MMLFINWDFDPLIFAGFEYLRWYGLSWTVGMMLAYKIMAVIYQSEKTPIDELDRMTTYLVIGAVLGARFGHILFYDPVYYWNHPIEILPFKINPFEFTGLAGLASHGGISGALIALYLYNRKAKRNYLWLLDRIAIAGAALGASIRFGNLLNSEIIGIPSSAPWAFVFTRIDMVPRHPAQLYEAISYTIISTILYFIWRSGKFNSNTGFIFGLAMVLIFMQRFLIEFLKENQAAFEAGMYLNMGQLLSVPLILGGLFLMIYSQTGTHKILYNGKK